MVKYLTLGEISPSAFPIAFSLYYKTDLQPGRREKLPKRLAERTARSHRLGSEDSSESCKSINIPALLFESAVANGTGRFARRFAKATDA